MLPDALPVTALQPDLCVVGASEAGRAVAMGAAAMGCSVLIIDDGDATGRRNRDLTLELLRAAARKQVGRPEVAFDGLQTALTRAAPDRSHARLAAMNIRVIAATASFRNPETLEAGGFAVRARRYVIATGRAKPPAVNGAAAYRLCDLGQVPTPESLVVRGGDPEALSAAQSLGRLGAAVTLAGETLLPGIDPELAAPLLRRLPRDGVRIVPAPPPDAALYFGECPDPALDALVLDRAAVARRDARLVLTSSLRTTNPRIFAVGCPAGALSTAAGLAQAGVVLRSAVLRLPVHDRPLQVPSLVLTDPEIAQVGLTEEAARGKRTVAVWRWPLGQTGPALTDGATGHVKVVTDRRGRILGAGIVGPQARELIGLWTLAIAQGLGLPDVASLPVPMPSRSEAVRGIAVSHAARRLDHPWLRRWLGLIRRLP